MAAGNNPPTIQTERQPLPVVSSAVPRAIISICGSFGTLQVRQSGNLALPLGLLGFTLVAEEACRPVILMPIELLIILVVMGGFLATLVGLAIWGRRRAKRRADEIRAVGSQLGLTYFPKADPSWLSTLSWRQKLSFSCINTLYGETDELIVRVFEKFYTVGVGPYQIPRWQTMVGFQSAALNDLPAFSLRPDTALDRIASFVGYKRIDFESHPSFSRTYILRASDEPGIRHLFDDEILAFFEQASNACVNFDDNWLLFCRKGVRVKPSEIPSFIDEGFAVYRRIVNGSSLYASSGAG